MKDCKKIHALLSFYQEGELSASERASVDKHLQACITARREMEKLGRLREALKGLPDPAVPSDLHAKIMARVTGNSTPLPSPRTFWNYSPWVLAAAGIAVFFTLVPYSSWKERGNRPIHQDVLRDEAGKPSAPQAFEEKPRVSLDTLSGSSSARDDNGQGFAKSQPAAPRSVAKKTAAKNEDTVAMNYNAPPAEARKDKSLAVEGDTERRFKTPAEATEVALAPQAGAGSGMDESESKLDQVQAKAPVAAAAPAMPEPVAGSLYRSTTSKEPTLIWKGLSGTGSEEKQELITDEKTFTGYWQSFYPLLSLPRIDFTKQAVVVLIAGEKPTAGYSLQVSRLEEQEDQLVIHYRVLSPPADAVTAQVITHPWTLQVISKPTKPVEFLKDP